MSTIINIKFSLFGPFYQIKPDDDRITAISEELKKLNFVNNMITGQKIDMSTQTIVTELRPGFVRTDRSYSIAMLDERFDINFNKPTRVEATSIELVLEGIQKQINDILDIFDDKYSLLSHRIAINLDILGENKTSNIISEICKQKINGIAYYSDKHVNDWSLYLNSREKVIIDELTEEVNINTNIDIARVNQSIDEVLHGHFDINTISENTNTRFTLKHYKDFMYKTKGILAELIKNFKEFDANEK